MGLAEAEVESEAHLGMARPRTAGHEAQCVAQFVALRRRGGAFGRSGRRVADRDGRVARSFHGTFCNSLIFNTGSKGCTMVRGQVQTEQEATLGFIALGQGESYQVKPGQTTF